MAEQAESDVKEGLPDHKPRVGVVIEFIPSLIVGGQPQTKIEMYGCGLIDVAHLCGQAVVWASQQLAALDQQAKMPKIELNGLKH